MLTLCIRLNSTPLLGKLGFANHLAGLAREESNHGKSEHSGRAEDATASATPCRVGKSAAATGWNRGVCRQPQNCPVLLGLSLEALQAGSG